jgi:D-serine deaminase-like pyridoxal phosphate-dependent protein
VARPAPLPAHPPAAFEQNCLKLKAEMEAFPSVAIRPHAKAHKCPQLARLQLQLLGTSAVGVCCQKVSEAEAMVAGGIMDVLVSNEVVAQAKLQRLVALAAQGASLLLSRVCVLTRRQGVSRKLRPQPMLLAVAHPRCAHLGGRGCCWPAGAAGGCSSGLGRQCGRPG